MQISDIGEAARSLADYIDMRGETANMDVVAAQADLITDRLREIKHDQLQANVHRELAVKNG